MTKKKTNKKTKRDAAKYKVKSKKGTGKKKDEKTPVRRIPVNQQDGLGQTLLHLACQNGDVNSARKLLKRGAAIDIVNNAGHTPMHEAIWNSNHEVLRELIAHGARLDFKHEETGGNYMHYAAQQDDTRIVRDLAENGVPINEKDAEGWTPLWYALGKNDLEIVECLLMHGADSRATNPDGTSPLEAARMNDQEEIHNLLTESNKGAVQQLKIKPIAQHTQRQIIDVEGKDPQRIHRGDVFIECCDELRELVVKYDRIAGKLQIKATRAYEPTVKDNDGLREACSRLKSIRVDGGITLHIGYDTRVSDLAPLIGVEQLKELAIHSSPVKDLSLLKEFHGLEILDLYSVPVSDITPLSKLRNIRELSLHDTEVSDIKALEKLSKLETLDLRNTRVSNLSCLHGLVEMEWLDLRQTRIWDLTPLRGFLKLKVLRLSYTRVSDLTPLQNLRKLKELDLQDTQVEDIGPIRDLKKLKQLKLQGTGVRDLSPLTELKNLRELFLFGSKASKKSIASLKKALPALTRIHI